MTEIIAMTCTCGGFLRLALEIKEKQIVAYCIKCGSIYEIKKTELDDAEVEDLVKRAEFVKEKPESLFYLRCTKFQV